MSTPATPQTNKLVAYNPQPTPVVGGVDLLSLQKEFARLRTSINSMQQIMRQLEKRLASGGL